MIETRNLQLIPLEPSHPETVMKDKKGLEPMLGVSVPDSWPMFPGAAFYVYEKLRSCPPAVGWWTYLFVLAGDGVLAGEGGFKSPPNESNEVEIGYAMVPKYRGGGRATEAARGLVGWAFSRPEVTAIKAETLPDGHASIRVLENLGMKFAGATDEVFRWRLARRDLEGGGKP